MDTTESGITTSFRLVQLLNAPYPMLVTVSGIWISFRLLMLENM